MIGGFVGISAWRGPKWMALAVSAALAGVAAILIIFMSINLVMLQNNRSLEPDLDHWRQGYERLRQELSGAARLLDLFDNPHLVRTPGANREPFTVGTGRLTGVAPRLRQLFCWALGMTLGSAI